MEKFKKIDPKLEDFAAAHNAEVHSKGTSAFGVPPEKIEERRILWIDGLIGKAILISPHFVSQDFDSPLWNFINLAWLADGKSHPKGAPFWEKHLLTRVEFIEIEKGIDDLLLQSAKNLSIITRANLNRSR